MWTCYVSLWGKVILIWLQPGHFAFLYQVYSRVTFSRAFYNQDRVESLKHLRKMPNLAYQMIEIELFFYLLQYIIEVLFYFI